mmetsp:Transcript_16669/g.53210  ORF Transcript_16669/g.53210 Transcript_16669/m.53210 type:complete len:439 (+) Transcript_16669:432-1748(+)
MLMFTSMMSARISCASWTDGLRWAALVATVPSPSRLRGSPPPNSFATDTAPASASRCTLGTGRPGGARQSPTCHGSSASASLELPLSASVRLPLPVVRNVEGMLSPVAFMLSTIASIADGESAASRPSASAERDASACAAPKPSSCRGWTSCAIAPATFELGPWLSKSPARPSRCCGMSSRDSPWRRRDVALSVPADRGPNWAELECESFACGVAVAEDEADREPDDRRRTRRPMRPLVCPDADEPDQRDDALDAPSASASELLLSSPRSMASSAAAAAKPLFTASTCNVVPRRLLGVLVPDADAVCARRGRRGWPRIDARPLVERRRLGAGSGDADPDRDCEAEVDRELDREKSTRATVEEDANRAPDMGSGSGWQCSSGVGCACVESSLCMYSAVPATDKCRAAKGCAAAVDVGVGFSNCCARRRQMGAEETVDAA